jgi:hypothetical protein
MYISFIKKRTFLSQIKFELDYDFETILKELEQETWIPKSTRDNKPGMTHPAWDYRWNLYNPKSIILNNILKYLHSDEVHDAILETTYEDGPSFQGLWDLDLAAMKKFAKLGAHFQKDTPGYELGLHLDLRRIITTGMIYLTETDDPNVSTYFLWNKDENNRIRMTTNFGDGWIQSNSVQCYHCGHNLSNKDRYSIIITLTIPAPN